MVKLVGGGYAHIKANNDFALLDDKALKRFAIYNPFLEEPEVQAEIWSVTLSEKQAEDAINNYVGTRMEGFYKIPDVLCDALFRWRMGWLPTKLHLENNSFPELVVSEFTQMQILPDDAWEDIVEEMIDRGWKSEYDDTIPHLPYDICIDKELPMVWRAWFLEQDYKTVLEQPRMTKPRNKKMSADLLPVSFQELLPEAMDTYHMAIEGDYLVVMNNDASLDDENVVQPPI